MIGQSSLELSSIVYIRCEFSDRGTAIVVDPASRKNVVLMV